ncbi:hypothetical protein WMF38_57095 [Sorangium sp. So ce118]
MKCAKWLVAITLVAASSDAVAQQEKPSKWTAGAAVSYLMLGDERPTGGPAPQLFFHGPIARGKRKLSIVAGARVTAFNFSSWYWMAMLAGPEIGMTFPLPIVPDSLGLYGTVLAGLDVGQWPMATNWGWPGRVWGTHVRLAPGVAYEPTRGVSIRGSLGVRHAHSPMNAGYAAWLPRHGLSLEPQISGVFGWGE